MSKEYCALFIFPYVENWKSMSKEEKQLFQINYSRMQIDPKKRVFIKNLPSAAENGGEETLYELKESVESLFADWEEKPTVLNVFRVGKPNSHGRKAVRILLETEKDAAMILEQNGKRVIHKDHGFWLHVYGEKVNEGNEGDDEKKNIRDDGNLF